MLTALDAELFPDDCEVVEIPSRDLWIYLIQKNGSTSLRTDADRQNWNIIKNRDLSRLSHVDVFLRDPRDRYLSGVNTFVQHLIRDDPSLDRKTCTHIAKRYAFLNRHYLPQWHWIVNLARFIAPTCEIRLHDMANLRDVTEINRHAGIKPFDLEWQNYVLQDNDKLEFWFLLDKILLDRIGERLTWSEILSIYREHPVAPLDIITTHLSYLTNVLCST